MPKIALAAIIAAAVFFGNTLSEAFDRSGGLDHMLKFLVHVGLEKRAVIHIGDNPTPIVTVKISGVHMQMVVDTGADFVCITYESARRLGKVIEESEFTSAVGPIGGEIRVAQVTLSTLELNGIILENVDALVFPPNTPGMRNLLGMSYISRLASMEFRSGNLILKQ